MTHCRLNKINCTEIFDPGKYPLNYHGPNIHSAPLVHDYECPVPNPGSLLQARDALP